MKQICFRAEALPNDYGAPVVKDCTDLLKIVKQIVGAFDLMVATDKAKVDDACMPKLVKMDKADSKEKVIKDWAIKNQMFDAGSNRRASRRRGDDGDSSGGEQPPRPKATSARGKAKGKANNT